MYFLLAFYKTMSYNSFSRRGVRAGLRSTIGNRVYPKGTGSSNLPLSARHIYRVSQYIESIVRLYFFNTLKIYFDTLRTHFKFLLPSFVLYCVLLSSPVLYHFVSCFIIFLTRRHFISPLFIFFLFD